jgi:hypothetical protein
MTIRLERLLASAVFLGALVVSSSSADARGTGRIQQRDGATETYPNVRISVRDESMWMTSSDGKSTLIIGDAACERVGLLVRCLPYDGTLDQGGERVHIPFQSGTVWLNPTAAKQQLSHSSTQLPPHGVLLAIRTKAGTYVSLSGVIDEIQR